MSPFINLTFFRLSDLIFFIFLGDLHIMFIFLILNFFSLFLLKPSIKDFPTKPLPPIIVNVFKINLTDLLSLTNEADSFYKTSQNQRLLVEILIMKLCSLRAEKKKLNFLEAPIIAPDFKDINLVPSTKHVENQPLKENEFLKPGQDELK